MQRLALLVYRDQEALLRRVRLSVDNIDPSLAAVAAVGGWGGSPGNIHREFIRWLGDPQPPRPLQITAPIKVTKPRRLPVLAETRLGILLPHEEFAQLHANQPAAFARHLLGAGSEAEAETTLLASGAGWRAVATHASPPCPCGASRTGSPERCPWHSTEMLCCAWRLASPEPSLLTA